MIIRSFYVIHWVFCAPLWLLLCPECEIGSKYLIWLEGLLAADERMPLDTEHNLMDLHLSGSSVWSFFIKWTHTCTHHHSTIHFSDIWNPCESAFDVSLMLKKGIYSQDAWMVLEKIWKSNSIEILEVIYVFGRHLSPHLHLSYRIKSKHTGNK